MKRNRVFTSLTAAVALLAGVTLFSSPSFAQATDSSAGGSSMMNLGALLGVGFLNKDLGTQIDLGLTGNYKIMPNINVGGYATYNSIASIPGQSASLWTVTPQASYVLEGVGALDGTQIGAKAGLGFTSTPSGTVTVDGTTMSYGGSSTSFVFGPYVAYDYPIGNGLSVGGEANYMIYTANEGFNAFNLLGSLKYWF